LSADAAHDLHAIGEEEGNVLELDRVVDVSCRLVAPLLSISHREGGSNFGRLWASIWRKTQSFDSCWGDLFDDHGLVLFHLEEDTVLRLSHLGLEEILDEENEVECSSHTKNET
jgi:hypothetical protein